MKTSAVWPGYTTGPRGDRAPIRASRRSAQFTTAPGCARWCVVPLEPLDFLFFPERIGQESKQQNLPGGDWNSERAGNDIQRSASTEQRDYSHCCEQQKADRSWPCRRSSKSRICGSTQKQEPPCNHCRAEAGKGVVRQSRCRGGYREASKFVQHVKQEEADASYNQ